MSSAKVVNHALSCHRLIHAITKVENPSTIKNSKSVFFRKGGLIALPRPQRFTSRHHSHRERNVRQLSATVFNGLPEPSINFDVEASVAEASALLALSADLDWQQYAAKLREEALGAFRKRNEREVALEQLGEDMRNWLHDSMYQSILQSSPLQSVQNIAEDELGVSIRVEELHWQAALQAAEELAKGVDSSFDWESEVLELRQCAINPERADFEQKLWNSWETARDNMDKNAKLIMHDEALKVQSPSDSYLTLLQKDNRDDSVAQANRSGRAHEMSPSLWALGLGTAGWFGSQVKNALAAEESVSAAITEAASKTAPGWVAPSVLAFPVVSYALFTLYRQKVNPYAKLIDWVFGLVAMGIIGNIVLIKTVGVRLY